MQEISVIDLNDRLQGHRPLQLLDVREDVEVAGGMLPGAIHVPLGQLSDRHAELSPDLPTVVYCHHGGRSAHAVQFLTAAGFHDVANLTGGTDAWSRLIDPSLPLY